MVITEILARNGRMYADEEALIEREMVLNTKRAITWKAFDATANRVANALISKGIQKGDKVIFLMVNCLEWLPIYFGILRTGAWAVPLNFRFTAKDIKYCIDIAEARAVIFGEEFIDRVNAVKGDLTSTRSFFYVGPGDKRPAYAEQYEDLIEAVSADPPDIPIGLLDEAGLYFTSGTTGQPKPILLTHRNLEAAGITENRHHNLTHEDNFLCIPPLYHTGSKMHWFGNLIVGGKMVIIRGVKPEYVLQVISEEQVTVVLLMVPWAQDILIALENNDVKLEDYSLDQWRIMYCGAQPIPPVLIENWKKHFPEQEYDTGYGLSESTGPGPIHLGIENTSKIGAIGLPGFDWECRIVDDHLKDVPKGDVGELMLRGPGVMKEYYKNPEATAKTLVDGWLLTGDMARYDEEGFIWLVDRKKDVVITGGENIFPVEIEEFLMENPKVQDAAVIGIPDERLGEIAAAVIKAKPGKQISEKEIVSFCEALPRYKRPRKIIFGDVPRNPTGKIEKPKLRNKYAGQAGDFRI